MASYYIPLDYKKTRIVLSGDDNAMTLDIGDGRKYGPSDVVGEYCMVAADVVAAAWDAESCLPVMDDARPDDEAAAKRHHRMGVERFVAGR